MISSVADKPILTQRCSKSSHKFIIRSFMLVNRRKSKCQYTNKNPFLTTFIEQEVKVCDTTLQPQMATLLIHNSFTSIHNFHPWTYCPLLAMSSSYSTTHLLNYFKKAQKVKYLYDTTEFIGLLLTVTGVYKQHKTSHVYPLRGHVWSSSTSLQTLQQ